MITEADVDKALEYLRDSARPAAVAKSQARMLKEYLTVVEAEQKALHTDKSNVSARDSARASPEYRTALDALNEAVQKNNEYTMLRAAAESRIEAWRTWEATRRIEGKAYR